MYEIDYNPDFVPQRSPKINIKTVTIDNEKKYFMKNHETGNLYDLSEFGVDLWNLIDGQRTTRDLTRTLQEVHKDTRAYSVKEALRYYAGEGLLEAVSKEAKKKRVNVISAFMVRVRLIADSNSFVQSVHRVVRPALKRSFLLPVLVLIAVMGIIFAGSFISIFTTKENFEIMGSTVVGFFFYYFIVLAPVIAVHETAHALALVHYGGAPREMGAGLYFFGPMFYVDVTDSWTLNRYERIMVYAAGSIAEMLIASSIMIAQFLWQFPAPISHILTMAVFYCFYGLLIDLSPLLETDGYFMLCDGLRIPDLRGKSFNYVKTLIQRPFKKKDQKEEELLTTKTKVILLIYAVLAFVWAVYLVLRSLMLATYMAQDTASSVLNVTSGIVNRSLTITAIVLSIASVLYFGMVMSGYGLMIFTSVKKALKSTLRFEKIEARNLSVFMYLPKQVSSSLFTSLKQKTTKAARSATRNFRIEQIGSTLVAVLHLSAAELALVQIKENLLNTEKKFDTVFKRFLRGHKNEILQATGILDPRDESLSSLLLTLGKQASKAGVPEAKSVVAQVIDRQSTTALYLLHSVCGKVWTVEVPPELLHEMGANLLPTLLVEDLSTTDLYDEVEDFKKRTIYGFDSLVKFAADTQRGLQDALVQPKKHQVICSFEPIRNRIIFVGRTERADKSIERFGNLFVCQAWCGYLDNFLSEINLSLFALNSASLPTAESVQVMEDGEVEVLSKNLGRIVTNELLVKKSFKDLKNRFRCANSGVDELKKDLNTNENMHVGSIDAVLGMNIENLTHLPSQFESMKILFKENYAKIKEIEKLVKKEQAKRKTTRHKKRQKRLALYPFLAALSIVLGLTGFYLFTGYATVVLITSAVLVNLLYWTLYALFLRSSNAPRRYPSFAFRQIHFFTLAFTQSLYKFSTTANVLTPDTTATLEQ